MKYFIIIIITIKHTRTRFIKNSKVNLHEIDETLSYENGYIIIIIVVSQQLSITPVKKRK